MATANIDKIINNMYTKILVGTGFSKNNIDEVYFRKLCKNAHYLEAELLIAIMQDNALESSKSKLAEIIKYVCL